jgi:hypothetical protein
MNRNTLFNPSQLRSKQIRNATIDLENTLASDEIYTESDRLGAMFKAFKDMFTNMGKPTMKKRYAYEQSPPRSEDINLTMQEIKNDIDVSFDESYLIGKGATDNFDFSVAERMRLRNRVLHIQEMANDYTVMAVNTMSRNIVIQDSFNNTSKVDLNPIAGNRAKVWTDQGFVTLAVTGATNNSADATVLVRDDNSLHGNGWPSNFGIVKKVESTAEGSYGDKVLGSAITGAAEEAKKDDASSNGEWELLWAKDRHDDPQSIFDSKPNTWFEYQIINFSDDSKKDVCQNFGLTFDNGEPIYYGDKAKDDLTLSLNIQLPTAVDVNWIKFNPYFATDVNKDNARAFGIVVKDVLTSDGTNKLTSVLKKEDMGTVIFSETMNAPDDLIDRSSYKGQAVFSFPVRKVKDIRIDLMTDAPYDTNIAHIYWVKKWTETVNRRILFWNLEGEKQDKSERVEGPKVSKTAVAYKSIISRTADKGREMYSDVLGSWAGGFGSLIGGVAGAFLMHFYNESLTIDNLDVSPHLEVFPGWRWCIGIRDIDIMTNEYAQTSTMTSINYSLAKEASSVTISAAEDIPDEMALIDSKKNDWIKYYLSFDGGSTWTEISPMERDITNGGVPKVIDVNSKLPIEARMSTKTYVDLPNPAKTIMLKAEFTRPQDNATVTPILENYTIRIAPKEVAE